MVKLTWGQKMIEFVVDYWMWLTGLILIIAGGIIIWQTVLVPRTRSAEAGLMVAQKYYSESNLTAAKAEYEAIIKKYPSYYLALNGLGNVLRDQNKLTEAEQMYLKVIDINPSYEFVYRNLLGVYQMWEDKTKQSDKIASFAAILKKGLTANGNSGVIVATALDYYREIGDTAKAQAMETKLNQLKQ